MAGVWILTVSVITSTCWIQLILGTCSLGKFGNSCGYSCHCGQSCDQTTGVCEGDCDSGWVRGKGANCQKENVAYRRRASSPTPLWLHIWTAEEAVDGNRDQNVRNNSCFNSADDVPSVWKVDLGDSYRIHDVRIYHQQNHLPRIRTAVIYLSNTSTTPSVPCFSFSDNTSATGSGIYDVVCDGIGRHITITDPTHLNLCEVEIYVCSPGVFGDDCNQFCHCLQAACDPVSGVCHGNCKPGWQGDRCDTECDADHYEINCVNTCTNRKCSDVNSSCDRHSGSCDRGCLPGWTGVDCTQECDNGTYGQNCSMACSGRKCAGDSSCDHVRGKCVSGCVSGWMGEDCYEACDSLHYGANCIKICASRHCVGTSYCNSTGDCDGGCEEGWTQADCTASLPQQTKPDRGEGILIPAVTVTSIVVVVVVVVAVVVGVIIWRRRRPALQESESHDYYNTRNLLKPETNQSPENEDTNLEAGTYECVNVMSDNIQGSAETYCTLNTDMPGDGASDGVAEQEGDDIYEPTEPRTYETLDSTSRDMDGDYNKLCEIK